MHPCFLCVIERILEQNKLSKIIHTVKGMHHIGVYNFIPTHPVVSVAIQRDFLFPEINFYRSIPRELS